ncbi:hypothetical protein [Vibrio sp. WXL210]|uniref:hypothetical protein n=1 Tax=Vibrio sp. WXL210 TaxID=3450709 RepID=UPI003EC86674
MKLSDLKHKIAALPVQSDPDVVTGESWLPERLIDVHLENDSLLHLVFDHAPSEDLLPEEGRGFVEHEIELLRKKVMQILHEPCRVPEKADALLGLMLMIHEVSSAEVIETIEGLEG